MTNRGLLFVIGVTRAQVRVVFHVVLFNVTRGQLGISIAGGWTCRFGFADTQIVAVVQMGANSGIANAKSMRIAWVARRNVTDGRFLLVARAARPQTRLGFNLFFVDVACVQLAISLRLTLHIGLVIARGLATQQ